MTVDLELRITLANDERTLSFELSSTVPNARFHHQPMGSVRLSHAPLQQLHALFENLSQLARQRTSHHRAPAQQADVREHLERLGQRLYRDLFPPELKRVYRSVRALESNEPLTLLITSDEPWIPWELAKPYERADEARALIDDPFLCERFRMTRWLAGGAPPPSLQVNTLALVSPRSDLPYTHREQTYFAELATRAPQVDVLPTFGTAAAVRAGLRDGAAHVWHFACHGSFADDDPDTAAVVLDDGELRADDIVGALETGINASHALVMLNACNTGRQGFALTGLGGWARQWVRAGASAFIGAQWEAHDELAAEFAVAFYEQLWAGAPLAEAAHAARMQIKALEPTNPTWLSYAVYGHPHLRVELHEQAGPQPEDEQIAVVAPLPLPPPGAATLVPTTQRAVVRSEPPQSEPLLPPPLPTADDFSYDVFISYRHAQPDEGWVRTVLVPALEQAELRVCLDVRDFAPGVPELNERMRAVEQSRRTVVVLSPAYMENELGELENLMAQTLGVENGQYRLLPVRFDPHTRVPLRLRIYWYADFADPARHNEALTQLIAAARQLPARAPAAQPTGTTKTA